MHKLQNFYQDSQKGEYSGFYHTSSNKDVLQRTTDGLTLRLCRSKRAGYNPYYVKDCTNNRFVSSLFTEHTNPQFEHDRVRYEMTQTSANVVSVQAVNSSGAK